MCLFVVLMFICYCCMLFFSVSLYVDCLFLCLFVVRRLFVCKSAQLLCSSLYADVVCARLFVFVLVCCLFAVRVCARFILFVCSFHCVKDVFYEISRICIRRM